MDFLSLPLFPAQSKDESRLSLSLSPLNGGMENRNACRDHLSFKKPNRKEKIEKEVNKRIINYET